MMCHHVAIHTGSELGVITLLEQVHTSNIIRVQVQASDPVY